jgi:hypothetical protein
VVALLFALFLIPVALGSPEALSEELQAAEESVRSFDKEGLMGHMESARKSLRQVDLPLTPRLAAAYHRMEGVEAHILRLDGQIIPALQAAVAVDPAAKLPADIAPEGNPLWQLYEEARARPLSAHVRVEPIVDHELWIDGRASRNLPNERPAIIQIANVDGKVVWTRYHAEFETNPEWPDLQGYDASPVFLGIAGALALTGVGLLGCGIQGANVVNKEKVPYSEGQAVANRANACLAGSGIASGLSGAMLAVGLAL